MRAYCNKKEDNFITYHQNREKEIERTREWEKLNPEKRKEYTIKYYKTEKGHRKRLAQQKRYREKKKLKDAINNAIEYIKENVYEDDNGCGYSWYVIEKPEKLLSILEKGINNEYTRYKKYE